MFDWDEANTAHIAEHGVLPSEAEEVVLNSPLDVEYTIRNGEVRLRQAGETLAGPDISGSHHDPQSAHTRHYRLSGKPLVASHV